jgi:hypothetical protein
MRKPEGNFPNCLKPFIREEVVSMKEAAVIARVSESTIRKWCNEKGIGRRIAGGKWNISRVALQMVLEEETLALKAYLTGDRTSECVKTYFDRFGIPLPKIIPAKSATSAISARCA